MYCRPVSRQSPCSSRACWKGVENNFEISLWFLDTQSESDLGAVNLSLLIWFARSTHSLHLERPSSVLSKMPQDKWHSVQTKELRNVSLMVDKDLSKSASLIFYFGNNPYFTFNLESQGWLSIGTKVINSIPLTLATLL